MIAEPRLQDIAHAFLMRIMRIGVKESDGDRADLIGLQFFHKCGDGCLIERHQDIAIGCQSFAQRVAPRARHQRLGPVDHQVIVIETLLISRLQHVAESFRRDECGLGPLALDQRVGGERRAVDEDSDS